jgi:general secretion pathway protein L
MLTAFATWWTRQMASLIDPLLRRVRPGAPDALLLVPGADTIEVCRRTKGQVITVMDVHLAEEPAVAQLRTVIRTHRRLKVYVAPLLSPLTRILELPMAAESQLDTVLRYEMDRLTPFAVDNVFFNYRVVARDVVAQDSAHATLRVELTLVPKAWVRPVLDRLSDAGLPPMSLEVAGADGVPRHLPTDPIDPRREARERLAWRLALGACAALAVATVAVPVLRQSLALTAAEDRIAALRPLVAQTQALRQRIAADTDGAARIAAARQQATAALSLLGMLTDTLPDDTWLVSLTLRQGHLVLEGHSAAANRLITAMAHEVRLRNPAFAAPLLRDETGGEKFTIQAEAIP